MKITMQLPMNNYHRRQKKSCISIRKQTPKLAQSKLSTTNLFVAKEIQVNLSVPSDILWEPLFDALEGVIHVVSYFSTMTCST